MSRSLKSMRRRWWDDDDGKGFSSSIDQDLFERATRAAAVMRKQVPSLRSHASALAGRPLRVEIVAEGSYTDGKTVYTCVPIELGDELRHYKPWCDKRDEDTLEQKCPACKAHEFVMTRVYHEISHCVFGSTDEVRVPVAQGMFEEACDALLLPDWMRDRHVKIATAYNEARATSMTEMKDPRLNVPLGIALAVTPYLKHFANLVEDARVNTLMFERRPGVQVMYRALRREEVIKGTKGADGTLHIAPDTVTEENQFIHGLLYMLEALDEDLYLESCTEKVRDELEGMRDLTDTFDPYGMTIESSFTFAVELLRRANELGYAKLPDEEPPSEGGKQGEGNPSDQDGDDEAEGSASDSGDPEKDSEGKYDYDGSENDIDQCGVDLRNARQVEADHEAGSAGDDESTDNTTVAKAVRDALNQAIEQGKWFKMPSSAVTGVTVIREGDESFGSDYTYTKHRRGSYASGEDFILEPPQSIMGGPLMRLRLLFEENRKASYQRNLMRGKINAGALAKRVPFEDPRVFRRRSVPGVRDYEVVISLDLSGSTVGINGLLEIKAAYAQAELLSRLGVPFSMWGHTSASHLYVFALKELHEPWDAQRRARLSVMGAQLGNIDGHAMEFMLNRLRESSAKVKILMYYSDGAMPAENYDEEVDILRSELATAKREGIVVVGVGINSDSPTEHGLDTVEVKSMDDLPNVVTHLEKHMKKFL